MGTFLETFLLLIIPGIIMTLAEKLELVRKIGAVTICYAFGFCIALSSISYDKNFSETLASSAVAIAIPVMLFTTNICSIKNVGKKMLISFSIISLTVMIISVVTAFVGNNHGIEEASSLSGMATGLYIGGTQNLFAVGSALINDNYNLINSAYIADSLIGGIYFLLILSIVKKIYAKVLGKKREFDGAFANEKILDEQTLNDILYKRKKIRMLIPLFIGALCFGIGVLVEYLVNGNFEGSMFIILTVSILGFLFSFIKPLREIKEGEKLSQYLILVFSFGLGMSLDINEISKDVITCLVYFGSIMFGSIIIHFVLCKIFKIDGGTSLVTSVAAIYGPPFVVTAAESYGDRTLIAPGVICGVTGLVIGNFLGIGIGKILMLLI